MCGCLVIIWVSSNYFSNYSPYHMFAYVMQGSIILTNEDNEQFSFHLGDAFFVPEGVTLKAKTTDNISLSFAILYLK